MQGKGSATHRAFSIYLEPYLCVLEIINEHHQNQDDLGTNQYKRQTYFNSFIQRRAFSKQKSSPKEAFIMVQNQVWSQQRWCHLYHIINKCIRKLWIFSFYDKFLHHNRSSGTIFRTFVVLLLKTRQDLVPVLKHSRERETQKWWTFHRYRWRWQREKKKTGKPSAKRLVEWSKDKMMTKTYPM